MGSWGKENEQRGDPICEQNEDGIEKYRDTLENLGKMALQKGNMWKTFLKLKAEGNCFLLLQADKFAVSWGWDPNVAFKGYLNLRFLKIKALWWIFSWVLAALLVGNPVHYKAIVSTLQGREGQKTEKQGFQVGHYFIVVGFINTVLKACPKLSLTLLRTTKSRQSCSESFLSFLLFRVRQLFSLSSFIQS